MGFLRFSLFCPQVPASASFRPLFILVPCSISVASCSTAERLSRRFDPVGASKGLEVESKQEKRVDGWGRVVVALRDALLFFPFFSNLAEKPRNSDLDLLFSPLLLLLLLSLSRTPSPTPYPNPNSRGKLVYVDPDHGHANRCQPACNFACSPFSDASPPFHLSPTSSSGGDPTGGEMGGPTNFVMLVDRGPVGDDFSSPCKFAEKVWNAQAAGASAVLVVNYEDRHTTMEAPDDQDEVSYKYLRNITIPAAFLTKTDGQALKDLLKRGKDAYVSLDWTDVLPKREVVEWEFWSNSNDQCGAVCDVQKEFVKEFVPAARQLEGNWTKFTPHYIVWVCPSAYRVRREKEEDFESFLFFCSTFFLFSSFFVEKLFSHISSFSFFLFPQTKKPPSSPPPPPPSGLRRVPRPVHPRRALLHPGPRRRPSGRLQRSRHRRREPPPALRLQIS